MNTELFKIFGSEALGRLFVPEGTSYERINMLCISPLHGRALAIRLNDFEWISVKGGGWNYGGPKIYMSAKDEELVFGLYPLASAIRELEVSRKIECISSKFPKVLYYKRFSEANLPQDYLFLKDVKFSNGEAVDACLLYTQLKCPLRVADLMYFNDCEKKRAIEYCCRHWGISRKDYTEKFTFELAEHVAILHKNGFINDTLDYGNVTALGEIVDYEWITAPGTALPDGTDGLIIPNERKEKEILYGAEVCLQLKAMLKEPFNLFDIYRDFVQAYSKINPEFTKENTRIKRILNKEDFVL